MNHGWQKLSAAKICSFNVEVNKEGDFNGGKSNYNWEFMPHFLTKPRITEQPYAYYTQHVMHGFIVVFFIKKSKSGKIV